MNSKIKVKYPIAVIRKIPETKLQELRSSIEEDREYQKCHVYGVDKVLYHVSVYPNGFKDKQRGRTWIYFNLNFEKGRRIEAEFTISIETANICIRKKKVYEESYGYGGQICTIEELFDPKKRFIVDGVLEIKVEGFVMIEENAPIKLCQIGSTENQLCIDLWNQEFKDFTIIADGKEITAHKSVLSARSPVFAAMFMPHTLEAQENKVVIPDFTFDVVQTAIKFCYDSSLVEQIVSIENQISLIHFFDKYDIQSLKEDLENFMISEINATNICLLANCSITSNSANLRRKCFKRFLRYSRYGYPVNDYDVLDKDFAFDLFRSTLTNVVNY